MKYMNQMTEEEKKMIRCDPAKNGKALGRTLRRMLPCLPAEETDTALLSRLTAARGYCLLGVSSQLRCFAV